MQRDCLEAAMDAWVRPRRRGDRQPQLDDCAMLARYEVFSNAQIAAITGLSARAVAAITQKRTATGGRLALQTLPLLQWLKIDYGNGIRNERLLRLIVDAGTSPRMVARLTGIHRRAIERMIA